ncbi:MAG TPA: ATP-binding protein [Roseiflexaceae bacterium]|nr:ATP-binding protein [Roseiflexaceae bacterium]
MNVQPETHTQPERISIDFAQLLGLGAALDEALLVVDPQGQVLALNPAAETLTGWTHIQAGGQTVEQICADLGTDLPAWVGGLLRQPAAAPNARITCTCRGARRDLEARALRLDDSEGRVAALAVTLRDTGAIRSEHPEVSQLLEHIRDQRRLIASIVTHVPGIVWEAWGAPDDAGQRIDFVSGYAERLLGYPVSDWLSTPNFWLGLVHPEDRARTAAETRALFEQGRDGVVQFRWVARDRRVIWAEAHCAVIRDAEGRPTGMRGVTMDITERKQVEQERDRLLELERAWHSAAELARRNLALMAEASALLADADDEGLTLERVTGLMVPQMADWCALDLGGQESPPRTVALAHYNAELAAVARDLHQQILADPASEHSLWRALRSGRAELCNAVPQTLRDGGVAALLVAPLTARGRTLGVLTWAMSDSGRRYSSADLALAEDLARRIGLALDNARLYREARDAVQARDQFLSIASHELKTPLTALLGYTDLVQRRTAKTLGERDRQALRTIQDQALRLNRLVSSMLDLSRIQTGRLEVDWGEVDLCALAERVVEEMQPTLVQHTLTVEGPDEPLVVGGDMLRLEQVLQQLIQNAVKYSPMGGDVLVRLRHNGACATVTIEDQGIGIPASALPRLFNRFYRASNIDARNISGMGIGLYIVKAIVLLHGGSVTVHSREGQGSSFTVTLPLVEAQRAVGEV